MKKILIINKEQYGQHIDTYKYCKYLSNEYSVSYICFDQGHTKIKDYVNVYYISKSKNSFFSTLIFINQVNKKIKKGNYDLIFVIYFSFCSIVRMINYSNNFLLDIRSSLLYNSYLKRKIFNYLLLFETYIYKDISIISTSLIQFLKLRKNNIHIVPLGADKLSERKKDFTNIHLFYIGTLTFRNIHDTVYALKEFIDEIDDQNIKITYDIFGDGSKKYLDLLLRSIDETALSEHVKFHGRKRHDEIQQYFDMCNLGVAYIPNTDFFDCQPPTKTFEYIGSGMVCLATCTSENKLIINDTNGILCNDDRNSFKNALLEFYRKRDNYNSEDIQNTITNYDWKYIVSKFLKPVIYKILN